MQIYAAFSARSAPLREAHADPRPLTLPLPSNSCFARSPCRGFIEEFVEIAKCDDGEDEIVRLVWAKDFIAEMKQRGERRREAGKTRELNQPKEVEEVEGGADEVVTGQVVG